MINFLRRLWCGDIEHIPVWPLGHQKNELDEDRMLEEEQKNGGS